MKPPLWCSAMASATARCRVTTSANSSACAASITVTCGPRRLASLPSAVTKFFSAARVQSSRGSTTPPALTEYSSMSAGSTSSRELAGRTVKPGARCLVASSAACAEAAASRSAARTTRVRCKRGERGMVDLLSRNARGSPRQAASQNQQQSNSMQRQPEVQCHAGALRKTSPARRIFTDSRGAIQKEQ